MAVNNYFIKEIVNSKHTCLYCDNMPMCMSMHNAEQYLPSHDNDKVKLVPLVAKVTIWSENSQRHHLNYHFHGEESKNTVIQDLKERANIQKGWIINTDNSKG